MKNKQHYSLGIVGVRGYVGKELLSLLSSHPSISIAWVSSRQLAGQSLSSLLNNNAQADNSNISVPAVSDTSPSENAPNNLDSITIESYTAEQVAELDTDIIVLALPNGLAQPFVTAIEKKQRAGLIIDLSADYRFTTANSNNDWIYSLPELDQQTLQLAATSKLLKISNPGCYATAMQLAIAPIKDLLAGPAHCFGVSGYSGAGTKPSPFNDAKNLKDNLIAYTLLEHLHEKEVATRLQIDVSFSPHVAAFFRGINMTTQLVFSEPQTASGLLKLFTAFYEHDPLVNCQAEIPTIKQLINTAGCLIGGFTVSADGKRATIVSCLDNLLKGAASQALQNINIALGLNPTTALLEKHQSRSGEQQ